MVGAVGLLQLQAVAARIPYAFDVCPRANIQQIAAAYHCDRTMRSECAQRIEDTDISQPPEQKARGISGLDLFRLGLFDHASEVEDDSVVVAPVKSGGPLGHLRHDSTGRAPIKPQRPTRVSRPCG